MTKLLFLSGSARNASINQKMAAAAAKMAADMDAEVTLISLRDYEMPIYNGDLEEKSGLPQNAIKLKKLFIEHDGFFIASPEFNSAYTPLLKNALDWISRPHEKDEAYLAAYSGKVAALGAMSPGGLGGLRGLVPLRMLLGNIAVHVIPSQTAIQSNQDTFDAYGNLADKMHQQMLQATMSEFIATATALKN